MLTQRRAFRGRAAVGLRDSRMAVALEELERREVLSYAMAEWYPLTGGQTWSYAGTAGGQVTTAVMRSVAGVQTGGQTTTRLDMSVASLDSTDSRFLKLSATGMRLVRHELEDSVGWQAEQYASGGVLLMPGTVEAGQTFSHSSTYTANSSEGAFTGVFTGTVAVLGEETITVGAGTFQALRIRRTESSHAVGAGWTADTTITETQWVARGLGMVRMDFTQRDRYSSGEDFTTTLQLGLTGGTLVGNLIGMRVEGKGLWVQNGDTSVTTADGTNYGGIDVNGATKTRVFTIYNTSKAALAIGSVRIGGANAGEFSMVRVPATTLAPGASTVLSVRFDPAASGFRYATISIPSSDPSANPYTFAVRGTGMYFPEIAVRRSDKAAGIASGSTAPTLAAGTSIGRTTAAGSAFIDRTFVITNTGLGTLVLSGTPVVLAVSPMTMRAGTPAVGYTVVAPPVLTIAPGASSVFTIRFDPTAVGAFAGMVVIESNARAAPMFTFWIVGTGK